MQEAFSFTKCRKHLSKNYLLKVSTMQLTIYIDWCFKYSLLFSVIDKSKIHSVTEDWTGSGVQALECISVLRGFKPLQVS